MCVCVCVNIMRILVIDKHIKKCCSVEMYTPQNYHSVLIGVKIVNSLIIEAFKVDFSNQTFDIVSSFFWVMVMQAHTHTCFSNNSNHKSFLNNFQNYICITT